MFVCLYKQTNVKHSNNVCLLITLVKRIASGHKSHWFVMTPDGLKAYTCVIMLLRQEGLGSDSARFDRLPRNRVICYVTCRVLCCSVALLLCMLCRHRAGCRTLRVSLVYDTVEFPSFIGASCSTQVTNLESLIITQLDQCATHPLPSFLA